jgi:hypothetical protein
VVRGLAASLSQGLAASPSFCLFSSGRASGHCLSPCQRQQKSVALPSPLLLWEMVDCAFSRPRASALTSSSVRASYTAYVMLSRTLQLVCELTPCLWTVSIIFLCPLSNCCRHGSSKMGHPDEDIGRCFMINSGQCYLFRPQPLAKYSTGI